MIKAVIFDYGGVIKKPLSWWDDMGRVYGVSGEEAKKRTRLYYNLFQKGHIAEIQFWEKISRDFKKPVPKAFILEDKKDYEESFYLYPEIVDFVKQLKDNGFKTAVMSNTMKDHVEVMRKNNGFNNFDVVVLSCEVGLIKPEKEIYLLTLDKLGVKAEESVFIDDKKRNILTAEKLGMKTVLAESSKQIISDIKKILDI